MRPARANFVLALLLFLAAVAAYSAAPGFDFVALDDPDYVTANARVEAGLSLEGVAWAFSTGHASNWHPLTWLSHMLDVSVFGLDPRGHHATNVLLHAVNTVLVFLVFARLTGAVGKSTFVAALFGLHPLHAESVAWISERKDVLSTLFSLLAIAAYAGYARRGGALRYLATAALLALGLLAKPMVVTLPFVFLLLDWWPLRRRPATGARKLVLEKAPFFALSLASAAVTYLVQEVGGAVKAVEAIPLGARVGNAAVAAVRYLADAVWPAGLAAFYPHPSLPGGPGLSAAAVAGSVFFLAAVTAAVVVVAAKRDRREFAFGWFFYLGTLVPVIGLVQVGLQARADRYTYVPLLGVFVAATWAIESLARRVGVPRAVLAGAGAAVAGGLVLATRAQAEHWRSSEALFGRALAVTGANFPVHYNYGRVLQEKGDARGAAEHYRKALAIHPGDANSSNNLGSLHLAAGNLAEARRLFEAAIAARPNNARALVNLGIALAREKDLSGARAALEKASALPNAGAEAPFNLGNVLLELGDAGAAIARYREALAIDPTLRAARTALASALLRAKRGREAKEELRVLVSERPDDLFALGSLAFLLATSKDESVRDGREGLRLAEHACELTRREEPGLLDVLAAAYAECGRFEDAIAAAERAVSLAESRGATTEEASLFRARLASYRAREALRE